MQADNPQKKSGRGRKGKNLEKLPHTFSSLFRSFFLLLKKGAEFKAQTTLSPSSSSSSLFSFVVRFTSLDNSVKKREEERREGDEEEEEEVEWDPGRRHQRLFHKESAQPPTYVTHLLLLLPPSLLARNVFCPEVTIFKARAAAAASIRSRANKRARIEPRQTRNDPSPQKIGFPSAIVNEEIDQLFIPFLPFPFFDENSKVKNAEESFRKRASLQLA